MLSIVENNQMFNSAPAQGWNVIGMNYKTAPLALRELFAFASEQIPSILTQLKHELNSENILILSTCNRTEIYTYGASLSMLLTWLFNHLNITQDSLLPHLYIFHNEAVIRHLLRVSAGLDSMIMGEAQILGQIKSAYQLAVNHQAAGSQLQRLFQYVFSAIKDVRHRTGINTNAISVAYCAIQLAKHLFTDLSQTRALLIGAGETIELLLRYLTNIPVQHITIINRSVTKAEQLAEQYQVGYAQMENLSEVIVNHDLIFSATSASLPFIGKGMVESALKKRRHKPFFMIDLALPRDIESEVGHLSDVFLYTLNDLERVIAENFQQRLLAAEEAEKIIDLYIDGFLRWQKELSAVNTIKEIRSHMDMIQQQELARALKRLQSGQAPEIILVELAHRLTHKFCHKPTVKLREAGLKGDYQKLALSKWLFDINTIN